MKQLTLAKKKALREDPIYHSQLISQFINRVMKNGKKTVAQKLIYDTFASLSQKGMNAQDTFERALNNVSPKLEVRPRRVGGASYQVPAEVSGRRKTSLAIRWLIKAANNRSNKEYHTFAAKLAAELTDAAKGEGEAIKRKETTQKMAEANKVFSHFRW